jgi:general secretion pathway protein J
MAYRTVATHNTCPRRALQRNAGFTLLEVMVAILLLTIIMSTAYGALRLGARSWEAGITRAIETGDFRTAAGFLQRQISQTVAMTWPGENAGRITFLGKHDQLRFIGPAPQQQAFAGLFEYSLAVQTEGFEKQLVLSYVPFDPDGESFQTPKPGQQQILAENLTAVSFEYYGVNTVTGARTTTATAAWHRDWAVDAMQLPELIRVQVQAGPAELQWPELIITLRARHQS